ncbi:Uncharacterised protein [Enterobacter cloacae]|nr:Uncharacterised protein [Enterobacter cloacae]
MNGDAFANAVTIADFHAGRFASILKILVNFADGGELIDLIVAANGGMTIHDNVRFQYCTLTNFDMGSNNTKRANVDVCANDGTRFHNGGRMNKGGFINHVSGLPATRTHHCRFANNFAVNHSYAFEASQAATRFFKSDFHDHLITRHDRTLEARLIDTREVIEFTRLQFTYAFKRQNTGSLCHRFQDQHTREDRFTREVPLEERLVNGDIFHCAQKTTFFKIQHTVYQ